MQLKLSVSALILALGLGLGAPAMTAERNSAGKSTPAANQADSEDLLARTVFQVLIGEFALRQGDAALASDAWSDLAERTHDPMIVARATEVAGFAKQYDRALELSRLWLALEPDSTKARQSQSSLLIMANRPQELAPQLAALLAQDQENLPNNLLHLNRMLARLNNPKLALHLIERLSEPYQEYAESHFAVAQAAASAGDLARAATASQRALQLRPNWETAALLNAQITLRQSPEAAIATLDHFVDRNPEANDARFMLARLLVSEKKFDAARKHYAQLITQQPENPNYLYPLALLALQQGDSSYGKQQLERLLATDFPDKATVHYVLGQLAQEAGDQPGAIQHFQQVDRGEQYISARARLAQLQAQQGEVEAARKLLQSTQTATANERLQLLLSEAQILRDAQRPNDAYIVLESALAKMPDNTDLLYDTALTAERIGKPEILEQHLRHLLKLQPDHPHALNALGYSFAERNIHLDEAYQLVSRALELSPNDPFITDSLGWVLYRQGKLQEALRVLEQAYQIKTDPEIISHLSEVLTALDRSNEARQLLGNALKEHPNNPLLLEASKKLSP